MTSMSVPETVMSLAISAVSKDSGGNFSKARNRIQKEDPTFRIGLYPESGQTLISGMGELHLAIYVERMRREYKVDTSVGKPRVNFRETITQRSEFDYLHKKQSGRQGQYGRVIGYMEPLPLGSPSKFEFENMLVGQAIPSNYVPATEKGFKEAANSYALNIFLVEYLIKCKWLSKIVVWVLWEFNCYLSERTCREISYLVALRLVNELLRENELESEVTLIYQLHRSIVEKWKAIIHKIVGNCGYDLEKCCLHPFF